MSRRVEDLTGRQFGYLTVISLAGVLSHGRKRMATAFLCHCSRCGREKIVRGYSLLKGDTTSCNLPGCKGGYLHGNQAAHKKYISYRAMALDRGYVFELPEDVFMVIATQPCYICADSLGNCEEIGGDIWHYTGIDRIDNRYGYTLDNVAPCCKKDNTGKLDMTLEEYEDHLINAGFRTWARRNGLLQ